MPTKPNILGLTIDPLTQTQVIQTITQYIDSRQPHHIVTANAEIIYQASRDPQMKTLIQTADLITPDGAGVLWAAKYLGTPLPQRVTGIDLIHAICQTAQTTHWRIYLLGAAPGIAQKAAQNLTTLYPGCQIIGAQHGYYTPQQEPQILAQIQQAHPDIILVALGAPRQEQWIHTHQPTLQIPLAIGIGGSLDVISGNLKRAPKWMQKLSLEWLYRILIQPTRLKRATALPKFVLAVRRQRHQNNKQK